MGVQKFEDLRVWQAAKALSDEVGRLLKGSGLRTDFALADQLNRAVLSTVANIAEGFIRGGETEFIRFLRIAAGSNGEVRALLYAAEGRGHFPKTESEPLVQRTNVIGRMLRKLMESLREGSTKHHRPSQGPRTSVRASRCVTRRVTVY